MSHEHHHCDHHAMHLGFKIAKLALKAASVAATICIAKEIHRVHKSIENHK